ncbi:MAG TPA: dienelactone hydrolase family protein [Hyphomonadaceae bacterium]|nr:dienelactone hydrolase family protein [Hyphomonadaceae bacterium]
MPATEITVRTPDGECPATLAKPDGKGPWPGVIMFMDGAGYRPPLGAFAQKIANHGFVVLLPDTLYRFRPYPGIDFSKPTSEDVRKQRMQMIMATSTLAAIQGDHGAFIAALDADRDVKRGKIGTTGYCMGGRISLMCAALFPDRVAAAAAFHPGNLVGDIGGDTLPPRLPAIKAKLLVAMAKDDAFFTDPQQAEFTAAFKASHMKGSCMQWPARHGWTMPDGPVYDAVQAERHWEELAALFEGELH